MRCGLSLEIITTITEVYEVEFKPPWPYREDSTPWIRLCSTTTPEEIGLVIGELAVFNEVPLDEHPVTVIADLLEIDDEDMTVPGGVRVIADDGSAIMPGPDCYLDDWRDWLAYQSDDFGIWMGEDVRVERQEEVIRVTDARGVSIDLSLYDMRELSIQLDRDLQAFRTNLRAWAKQFDPELADALGEKFDLAF